MAPRKRDNKSSKFMKISVSVPWELLNEFDDLTKEHGYQRSEAIRQGMRTLMDDLRKRKRQKQK